jgi:hypothetical protein
MEQHQTHQPLAIKIFIFCFFCFTISCKTGYIKNSTRNIKDILNIEIKTELKKNINVIDTVRRGGVLLTHRIKKPFSASKDTLYVFNKFNLNFIQECKKYLNKKRKNINLKNDLLTVNEVDDYFNEVDDIKKELYSTEYSRLFDTIAIKKYIKQLKNIDDSKIFKGLMNSNIILVDRKMLRDIRTYNFLLKGGMREKKILILSPPLFYKNYAIVNGAYTLKIYRKRNSRWFLEKSIIKKYNNKNYH